MSLNIYPKIYLNFHAIFVHLSSYGIHYGKQNKMVRSGVPKNVKALAKISKRENYSPYPTLITVHPLGEDGQFPLSHTVTV